jgi:hypothetical protein
MILLGIDKGGSMWISRKRLKKLEEALEKATERIGELESKSYDITVPFDNLKDVRREQNSYGYSYTVYGEDYTQRQLMLMIVDHLGITYKTGTDGSVKFKEKEKTVKKKVSR